MDRKNGFENKTIPSMYHARHRLAVGAHKAARGPKMCKIKVKNKEILL